MNDRIPDAITNIIFDLDGTLVHERLHLVNFIDQHFKALGMEFTKAQLKESGTWFHKFWERPDTFARDMACRSLEDDVAFWLDYLTYYHAYLGTGQTVVETILPQLARSIASREHHVSVKQGTESTLSTLKEQGYTLGVLSNRYNPIDKVLQAYGLDAYFSFAYTAGELGAAKPDTAIFDEFAARAGISLEESVYVGDNYWLDALASRRAGMTPILLDVYGWYEDPEIITIATLPELLQYVPANVYRGNARTCC